LSELVAEKEIKIVIFAINHKEYALSVQNVVSIEKMQPITRVPNVPSYVKGVINLRGVITPIIDLRTCFQLESQEYNQHTRIIIVSIDEKNVGLIVDEANDVINIFEKDIEQQPDVIGIEKSEFISGVVKLGDRLLILLNLKMVLNIQEDQVQQ
jgi:purine-binding chemotaxis protein CheW